MTEAGNLGEAFTAQTGDASLSSRLNRARENFENQFGQQTNTFREASLIQQVLDDPNIRLDHKYAIIQNMGGELGDRNIANTVNNLQKLASVAPTEISDGRRGFVSNNVNDVLAAIRNTPGGTTGRQNEVLRDIPKNQQTLDAARNALDAFARQRGAYETFNLQGSPSDVLSNLLAPYIQRGADAIDRVYDREGDHLRR